VKGLNLKHVLILDQDSLNPIKLLSQGILVIETAEALKELSLLSHYIIDLKAAWPDWTEDWVWNPNTAIWSLFSLHGKRFRGVREQRLASWKKNSLSFCGSRPSFRLGKTLKIPFLGLSLLPSPTETLAIQASRSSASAKAPSTIKWPKSSTATDYG